MDCVKDYDWLADLCPFSAVFLEMRRRDGQIPKEYRQAYAQLLSSPMMSLLCKNNGEHINCLKSTGLLLVFVLFLMKIVVFLEKNIYNRILL